MYGFRSSGRWSLEAAVRGGKRLTAHGLTKFDKEALYTPARRFYRLLGRMRKMLEEDFGFKPTDS
ncbi:hypothetical protein [Parapedobacter sp. 2B3]|uniref:hypothetical protein n=1 Tax=Parapedobacter sp. 2B3 TaxID=3342381 RepID=UPI0035B58C6D